VMTMSAFPEDDTINEGDGGAGRGGKSYGT
jgi:hypothetical protein